MQDANASAKHEPAAESGVPGTDHQPAGIDETLRAKFDHIRALQEKIFHAQCQQRPADPKAMAGMAYEEIVAAFEAKSVGQDEIQSLMLQLTAAMDDATKCFDSTNTA
ncbi:Tubulin-specific chaperone A [Plasmodiophora brassicae]|uniref:Tubulin-specific chaperone A n=1 Tax=Plasmodiophora brassicae TaxID=37360 RepID=A0A0G4ILS5_PLABS|nr:hypothetical protein PBRA_004732 [Plasmodiophora brassicae]SPQ93413.1 unnamed protein product [Plasmodiophora brassicae]